jgi:hypothetical protein
MAPSCNYDIPEKLLKVMIILTVQFYQWHLECGVLLKRTEFEFLVHLIKQQNINPGYWPYYVSFSSRGGFAVNILQKAKT